MIPDLTGQTVVIVAVAAPLKDALVEAFAARGAMVAAVDEESVSTKFDAFAKDRRQLDALIHGAHAVPRIACLEEYSEAHLRDAISSGAWPVVSSLLRAKAALGRFPRHTVALTASSADRAEPGADFSAAADAVLETLCRFLSQRLAEERAHFNLIRHRTRSPGAERDDLPERLIATAADVANAAVALCSGWMDSMCGQVLTVDRGAGFCDNVFRRFAERAQSEI